MTEPTAQELTDEQIRLDVKEEQARNHLQKEHERFVKQHIQYSVKEGRLSEEEATQMTFEEMEEYVDWCDVMANGYLDYVREEKA